MRPWLIMTHVDRLRALRSEEYLRAIAEVMRTTNAFVIVRTLRAEALQ